MILLTGSNTVAGRALAKKLIQEKKEFRLLDLYPNEEFRHALRTKSVYGE